MIQNANIANANVFIKSKLSLDDLSSVISEKFLLGLKFGGREKFLMNENPAVFIRHLFGIEIVLWHDLDEPEIFHLDINNYVSNNFNVWQFIEINSSKSVNFSSYITGILILEGFDCYCYDDSGVNIDFLK